MAKHVLFKIVSYRHNFTHLVVRRLYYNIYMRSFTILVYTLFSLYAPAIFFRDSLVLNFEPIFCKLLSCPTLYPSHICLKWYLGLVPSLSTIHSFVATIILKINSSQNWPKSHLSDAYRGGAYKKKRVSRLAKSAEHYISVLNVLRFQGLSTQPSLFFI